MNKDSRLYINQELEEGKLIILEEDNQHYIKSVLRGKEGESINIFNNKEEYKGEIEEVGKKEIRIRLKSLE